MSDNKCATCKRKDSHLERQTCVGFRNCEAMDHPSALIDLADAQHKPELKDCPDGLSPYGRPTHKWLKFLPIVKAVAALSKDPSTKVGCIALDDSRNIVATGYNGFPRGVNDDPARYNDRPTKYKLISHAEQNLVAQAAFSGQSLAGTTVVLSALYPCSACAKSLIQAGVKRIIAPMPDTDPRWAEEARWAQLMFAEAGVEVIHY